MDDTVEFSDLESGSESDLGQEQDSSNEEEDGGQQLAPIQDISPGQARSKFKILLALGVVAVVAVVAAVIGATSSSSGSSDDSVGSSLGSSVSSPALTGSPTTTTGSPTTTTDSPTTSTNLADPSVSPSTSPTVYTEFPTLSPSKTSEPTATKPVWPSTSPTKSPSQSPTQWEEQKTKAPTMSPCALKDIVKVISITELKEKVLLKDDSKVWELTISGPDEVTLDFVIPADMCVLITGEYVSEELPIVNIVGEVQLFGSLSLRNLKVVVSEGNIVSSDATSFSLTDSYVEGLDRCPPDFTEVENNCLYLTDTAELYQDADATCEIFQAGSVVGSIIDASQVASHFLSGTTLTAWIANGECQVLTHTGAISTLTQPCDQVLTRALCSYPVKVWISGDYVSNNSTFITGSFQSFHGLLHSFSQSSTPDNVRRVLEGSTPVKIAYPQEDYSSNDEDEVQFWEVTATSVSRFSVEVLLQRGKDTDLSVGIDTSMDTKTGNFFEWEGKMLPQYVQIHLNSGAGDVCITSVSMIVESGAAGETIFSLPASVFKDSECFDFNVCPSGNNDCGGRTLAFYDETNDCLVLSTSSDTSIPRDLGVDLYSSSCERLTTWHHQNLGEPIEVFIETSATLAAISSLGVRQGSSDLHQYAFQDLNGVGSLPLELSTILPAHFDIAVDNPVASEEVEIRRVGLRRYGLALSEVDFSILYDCINVCQANANPTGVLLGGAVQTHVKNMSINFNASPVCDQLEFGIALNEEQTGRDVCTSPAVAVSSREEITTELATATDSSAPYRTLVFNLTSDITDASSKVLVQLSKNRGLVLVSNDEDIVSKVISASIDFVVVAQSYMEVSDVDFQGDNVQFLVSSGGTLVMENCEITTDTVFIKNSGTGELSTMDFLGGTSIENSNMMELTFVKFADSSSISNVGGVLTLSRLNLHEAFTVPIEGSIIWSDTGRFYEVLDDEDCLGDDTPHQIDQLDLEECQAACDQHALPCSGVLYYNDDDMVPQCGYCLQEEECNFNCAVNNSEHLVAESKFYYTSVEACPYLPRSVYTIEDPSSMQQCFTFCSYFEACEGISLLSNGHCELLAEVDLVSSCSVAEQRTLLLPYAHEETNDFHGLYGAVLPEKTLLLKVSSISSADKCAAVCQLTLTCNAFAVSNGECELFQSGGSLRFEESSPTDDVTFYVDISQSFPKKDYLEYMNCYISDSYLEVTTEKTVDQCRKLCDGDDSCAGFAWDESDNQNACALYSRGVLVDNVFGPASECTGSHQLFLVFSLEQFLLTSESTSEFKATQETITGISVRDDCSNICLLHESCNVYEYDTVEGLCTIGELVETSTTMNVSYYEGSQVKADIESVYVTAEGCYEKEPLELPVLSAEISTLSVCETICDLHSLCSSFVFDGSCELFSDVRIERCAQPKSIHLSISYRERDVMVSIPSSCLVQFENLKLLGCYISDTSNTLFGNAKESGVTSMTPLYCQNKCLSLGLHFYGVQSGVDCFCGESSVDIGQLGGLASNSSDCDIPCSGDANQMCGGKADRILIGETPLSIDSVSLAACKDYCYGSRDCEAVIYDATSRKCHTSKTSDFYSCATDTSQVSYIQSFEHYYDEPLGSYFGDTVVYETFTATRFGCETLCDAYTACEAIRYSTIDDLSCSLLGGGVVEVSPLGTTVLQAHDVSLFTRGFAPPVDPAALIASFSGVFDYDECATLAEQHVEAGSFVFENKDCRLYSTAAFADPSASVGSYYIDYQYYIDPKKEFNPATGLCVVGDSVSLDTHATSLSLHDCAERCNSNAECVVFTFEDTVCSLFSSSVELTSSCAGVESQANVLFSRAQFTLKEQACLKDESQGDYVFELRSRVECAALCDAWFNCRSFRYETSTGTCRLHQSEQFMIDCTTPPSGELYLYYSEFHFTRLDESFCVNSNSELAFIEDTPIEACKMICSHSTSCVSFEHNQAGDCVLYSTSDFSTPCSINNNRDLYISHENVVNPDTPKVVYTRLLSCFQIATALSIGQVESCEDRCTEREDCYMFQDFGDEKVRVDLDEESTGCFLFLENNDVPLEAGCTVNGIFAYFKVPTYPYKTAESTCLRNKISLPARLYDVQHYECLQLCDSHPQCRYFIHGESDSTSDPELNECILFEAQTELVDDCEDYSGLYREMKATVYGRTYFEEETFLGKPETIFSTILGFEYAQCSAMCEVLEMCSSFMHTTPSRRPLFETAALFEKSRLQYLEYAPTVSLFLSFDVSGGSPIVDDSPALTSADVDSANRRAEQLLILEQTGSLGDTYHLKLAGSNVCLQGGAFSELEAGYARDVIESNFQGTVPICQALTLGDCSDSSTLDLSMSTSNGEVEFSYLLPKTASRRGCLRIRPSSFQKDYTVVNGGNGNLTIPPENGEDRDGIYVIDTIRSYFDGSPQCAHADLDLFSLSYGDGCSFDDGIATFQTQKFVWASEEVYIMSADILKCIKVERTPKAGIAFVSCSSSLDSSSLEMAWTYLFETKQLYVMLDNKMRCMAVGTGDVSVKDCDATDSSQRFTYDSEKGTLEVESDPGKCICSGLSFELSVKTGCECDSPSAKFVKYTRCELTTHEKSPPIQLESVDQPGQCINIDGDDLEVCSDESPFYQVFYPTSSDPFGGAIAKQPEGDLCVGRVPDSQDEDDLTNMKTGLTSCSSGVPLKSWFLSEAPPHSFYWVDPAKPDDKYCLKLPASTQVPCETETPTWRAYGSTGDIVSVKPGSNLIDLSDPEVAFQFFLYTAEGRSSRILKSRLGQLLSEVERVQEVLAETDLNALEAFDIIDTVQNRISTISDELSSSKNSFKAISVIVRPFESFPYVGPIVKATNIRLIASNLAKQLGSGVKRLQHLSVGFEALVEPINEFRTFLQSVPNILYDAVDELRLLVGWITQQSFCAFQTDLDLYQTYQDFIDVLVETVAVATKFLSDLPSVLAPLNTFKSSVLGDVLDVIDTFFGLLNPMFDILDSLSFLDTIYEWKWCLKYPSVTIGKKCKKKWGVKICWPQPKLKWKGNSCVGLEDVGNLLRKVEKKLKKWFKPVYNTIEKGIKKVLGGLFKALTPFAPSFDIGFGFDSLVDSLSVGMLDLDKTMDFFTNELLPYRKIFDFLDGTLAAFVEVAFPTELLDVISCDTVDCLAGYFGINVDANFTGLGIAGFDFTVPTGLMDDIKGIINGVFDLETSLWSMLEAGVECNKYETLKLDIGGDIRKLLGLNESEFPIPDCPQTVEICTSLNFLGLTDEFTESFVGSFEGFLGGSDRRRRALNDELFSQLDSYCSDDSSWGVAVPVHLHSAGSKFIDVIFQVGKKLGLSKDVEEARDEEKHSKKSAENVYNFLKKVFTFTFDKFELVFDATGPKPPKTFKIVFGCEGPKFMLKLKVGSGISFGFKFRGTQWSETLSNSLTSLPEPAELIALKTEIWCFIDYVESTVNACVNSQIFKPTCESKKKQYFGKILGEIEGFSSAAEDVEDIESVAKAKLFHSEWEKHMEDMTKVRARMISRAKADHIDLYNYEGVFRLYGVNDCAGAPSLRAVYQTRNEDVLASRATVSVEALLNDLSDVEYHPTAYGNLFGSGWTIAYTQTAILQDRLLPERSKKHEASFPIEFVGPFPLDNAQYIEGEASIADFKGTFFQWLTNGEQYLSNMTLTGSKSEWKISKREVSSSWTFVGAMLNLREDEESQGFLADNTKFCEGPFCISIGFDPAIFNRDESDGT